jgi:hypothetical protein
VVAGSPAALLDAGSRIEIDGAEEEARRIDIAGRIQSNIVRTIIGRTAEAECRNQGAGGIELCQEDVLEAGARAALSSWSRIEVDDAGIMARDHDAARGIDANAIPLPDA